MLTVLMIQRQRQKDCEFKTTLDCMLPVTKYNKGWRCTRCMIKMKLYP